MAMSKFSVSSVALPLYVCGNCLLTIPFVSKVKKMDKMDRHDADKAELIKLEFIMDPDNPTSNYS
jgi:hypothetical protein